MKAYAKVGQGMDPASACPEEKAIALHCAAVERYNLYNLEDRSSDAKFGTIILRFAYSVGFFLTFSMTPLFIGLLFKILNRTFDGKFSQNESNVKSNGNADINPAAKPPPTDMSSTNNYHDTAPRPTHDPEAQPPGTTTVKQEYDTNNTETEESNYYHYKPMFIAASIVSLMYSFVSISIAFYHLPNKSRQPLNEFEKMKTSFLVVLLVWLIFLDVLHAVYYNKKDISNYCMKMVLAFFAVFSLGALAADVMLSLPPTILLLFAYPINSSALLALHIAIFYCATMVLAVYFTKIHKWITKHHSMTTKICTCCDKDSDWVLACIHLGWFGHIFLGLIVLVALPITYICIMFFYQFVVARSNTDDISLNGLSLYIPSVVIAVFGFVIKKGAFEQATAEEKKKKEEQMLIAQAQKIWTVLGQCLEDNDDRELLLSKMNVNKLANKLKSANKEETAASKQQKEGSK